MKSNRVSGTWQEPKSWWCLLTEVLAKLANNIPRSKSWLSFVREDSFLFVSVKAYIVDYCLILLYFAST